jgi:hypothetical protein
MRKWLGLALMSAAVLTGLVSGALVFRGLLPVESAYTIMKWCFLPAVVGFALHMPVVLAQWREKKRSGQKHEA